jgi:hypothetical protein
LSDFKSQITAPAQVAAAGVTAGTKLQSLAYTAVVVNTSSTLLHVAKFVPPVSTPLFSHVPASSRHWLSVPVLNSGPVDDT